MPEKDKDYDMQDVIAEETSRGTRRPIKAVTNNRARKIKKLADLLADENCDERAFMAAIRGYGLQENDERFAQAVKLWRQRHGKT